MRKFRNLDLIPVGSQRLDLVALILLALLALPGRRAGRRRTSQRCHGEVSSIGYLDGCAPSAGIVSSDSERVPDVIY